MTVVSGTPAYVQVAADLRSQIESGRLGPGSKLPSNAELRVIYKVSNTVVRDAINELRRAGLVVGQQGKGVFVASVVQNPADMSSSELLARIQTLEDRVNSLEDESVRDMRHEMAVLRTSIIDLYVRMGLPYPREMADAGSDREPSAKPANRSA